jgi:hypothetical protein
VVLQVVVDPALAPDEVHRHLDVLNGWEVEHVILGDPQRVRPYEVHEVSELVEVELALAVGNLVREHLPHKAG